MKLLLLLIINGIVVLSAGKLSRRQSQNGVLKILNTKNGYVEGKDKTDGRSEVHTSQGQSDSKSVLRLSRSIGSNILSESRGVTTYRHYPTMMEKINALKKVNNMFENERVVPNKRSKQNFYRSELNKSAGKRKSKKHKIYNQRMVSRPMETETVTRARNLNQKKRKGSGKHKFQTGNTVEGKHHKTLHKGYEKNVDGHNFRKLAPTTKDQNKNQINVGTPLKVKMLLNDKMNYRPNQSLKDTRMGHLAAATDMKVIGQQTKDWRRRENKQKKKIKDDVKKTDKKIKVIERLVAKLKKKNKKTKGKLRKMLKNSHHDRKHLNAQQRASFTDRPIETE